MIFESRFGRAEGARPEHNTPSQLAARWTRDGVLAALAILATGCGGGSSASIGAGPSGNGEGGVAPSFEGNGTGPVVARLRMPAPSVSTFTLRATIPVPPGTYRDGASLVPLTVLAAEERTPVPTQVQIVTRYPNADDGADVLEVIARVERPNVEPGTPIEYDVLFAPHEATRQELSPAVETLLDAPGSLRLVGNDPFGNRYEADILAPRRTDAATVRRIRTGSIVAECAIPSAMTPVSPTSGPEGTLPRLMGVNAFVRTFANEDFVALDLHVHNGFDGQDPNVAWDAVLKDLYFEKLHLRVPNGWHVLHAFDSPYAGPVVAAGNMQEAPIVGAMPGGQMHLMPQQSQFARRLILARDGAVERARAELDCETMAFCVAGQGQELYTQWSWWNPTTARYLPQNFQIADLSGVTSQAAIDAEYVAELDRHETQMRTGAPGNYPVLSPNLGWAHPFGVAHGGMTGGDMITQNPGIDVAWSGSQKGYRYAQLRARMQLERQPQALLRSDGQPSRYEDFVVPTGLNGPHFPFNIYMNMTGNHDFFGFESAPAFHAQHVASSGKKPAYEDALREYQPNDLEHLIRYTSDLYTQIWLGNDSLAKHQMLQTSELFRMSHQELYIGNYAYTGGFTLKKHVDFVAQWPGVGLEYGRAEAWGLYASAGAYAFADDRFRDRYRPWFAENARVVSVGQSECTGIITAKVIGKHLNGLYRTKQSFEQSFVVNALESMRTTVFEGEDETMNLMLAETIVPAAQSTTEFPFWDPAWGGLRKLLAVGMGDMSTPDFCRQLPQNASYGYTTVDNETCMNGWAFAYRISGDEEFLNFAATNIGLTANLESELGLLGMDALKHYGLLLGLIQTLPPSN